MSWLAINIISALLLPPLNVLLLMATGLFILKSHRRTGMFLLWAGIVALWLLATPAISRQLLQSLEQTPPVTTPNPKAQAIVLLGGGRYFNAPEFDGNTTISTYALERTRYAAHLSRRTGLPILASGGAPDGPGKTEGELLKNTLEQDFKAPVRWVESVSSNTSDEARECWQMLSKENVTTIYLVTHAWHMPRSVAAFKNAGFNVTPAPMGYTTNPPSAALDWVPHSNALNTSRTAIREYIGLLWYHVRKAA
jgi:uncharacterized SAM-binding protein YcdF (DUF218 family)